MDIIRSLSIYKVKLIEREKDKSTVVLSNCNMSFLLSDRIVKLVRK
jgi:hypothetical protein